MHSRTLVSGAALAGLLLVPGLSARGDGMAHPPAQNVAEMKLVAFPGLPTCATGSVQDGDPATGPSIIFAKMAPGCIFPWHWHTPSEHLMMVSGEGRMEMKDGQAMTLRAGAFAKMPSKHVHQFSCAKGCQLYVYSDAAFDMHYVDAQGQELSPVEALKRVKETPAPAPAK